MKGFLGTCSKRITICHELKLNFSTKLHWNWKRFLYRFCRVVVYSKHKLYLKKSTTIMFDQPCGKSCYIELLFTYLVFCLQFWRECAFQNQLKPSVIARDGFYCRTRIREMKWTSFLFTFASEPRGRETQRAPYVYCKNMAKSFEV